MSDLRQPAVAGTFYSDDPIELRAQVETMLAEAGGEPAPALGGIVPHAGLVYSGACAAHVFSRISMPQLVVIIAPNHHGLGVNRGGAGAWDTGSWQTPLGVFEVAQDLLSRLESECGLVAHDPEAHRYEHAVEVELPFLSVLAPEVRIAPIVLDWVDWHRCKELADALAKVVRDAPEPVLLLASSDMTHYESAEVAADRDRKALAAVEQLDGQRLLATCQREQVSMCGRAPAATVIEATRQLGATRAEVVDYRNSGWVRPGKEVVAYAGVVIRL
ncbi:MAG: AmmeMemoRadiSam system protein B [Gemmatimonadota bacterium]|nr:MAG: AmmeMemoRadiSam system protein B [Gemmatimonadota bacterium]